MTDTKDDAVERALEISGTEIVSRSLVGPTNHDAKAAFIAALSPTPASSTAWEDDDLTAVYMLGRYDGRKQATEAPSNASAGMVERAKVVAFLRSGGHLGPKNVLMSTFMNAATAIERGDHDPASPDAMGEGS